MSLSDYRKEIDSIDNELIKLFEKRMNVAIKVAEYKIENDLPIFNGAREEEVIKKNTDRLENKEYESITKNFFNNIMTLSRELQKKKFQSEDKEEYVVKETIENGKIGFQGVEGSFSEEALISYFGKDHESTHYDTFQEVFEALKNSEIDYGVVPVENSSTGAITDIYDLMNTYGLYIVGEKCIKINQHLIGVKGSTVNDIKEVYSHQQGFIQSTEFLKNYSEWKCIPYFNTAISVKKVYELQDKTKAAIGSRRAAEIYNLDILKENINNQSENQTRFLVIGRNLELNDNCNKVSVVFSLEDEVGTLNKLINCFSKNNINLKKIESRPIKNLPWRYLLYIDFEGNLKNEEVKTSLDLIKNESRYFKLLGNYNSLIK